ncbi:MAG: rhodanese-like domain-containing protein [Vampirovibrionia bacterium]|jgi:rhodanese-related sulfurtransferase
MGNKISVQKVNFEDIQNILSQEKPNNVLLINTLDNNKEAQSCILPKTVPYNEEERIINLYLKKANDTTIIIYGKNCNDTTIYTKYTQLLELGFSKVYIYPGGMFEWLLLQDIYSDEHFTTTTRELDILKFKPKSEMNTEDSDQNRF